MNKRNSGDFFFCLFVCLFTCKFMLCLLNIELMEGMGLDDVLKPAHSGSEYFVLNIERRSNSEFVRESKF